MSNQQYTVFFAAMEKWLCNDHSLHMRYLAIKNGEELQILSALMAAMPTAANADRDFQVVAGNLYAGQVELAPQSVPEMLDSFNKACAGEISVQGLSLTLKVPPKIEYYSEVRAPDTWYSVLNLQVLGEQIPLPSYQDFVAYDNLLRVASPPFDGITDLVGWLGLADPRNNNRAPYIDLRVGAPVDLLFNQGSLRQDKLVLNFQAMQGFDISKVDVAIRTVPGEGVGRHLISELVQWQEVREGYRHGSLEITQKNAVQILVMLSLDKNTVRRHWFVDLAKSRNARLASFQAYDSELPKLRDALLKAPEKDSRGFEKAVNSLLYLLGFSSAQSIDTEAPDIVAVSPSGRVLIVECTIKTSDTATKIGKLVDRRGVLVKRLKKAELDTSVVALLVCATPRDQISYDQAQLKKQKVMVVAKENIEEALTRLNRDLDPDALLEEFDRVVEPPEGLNLA